MKKIEHKLLLFLVLVLFLSGGITYLALHQSSKSKNEEDVLKMTVALVNEDQGATFDDTAFSFGDEFIKSVEKDNAHDWYVVSRGVAENGLQNNAYNMMIVIPNDFSERALSIDADAPEKIKLNYKINASGNSDVKAEAEKTASVILGDFNRRIIDVYFASVIGNLQDAQDNISTIVEKQALYTNTYKNAVHSPLSQYTSQFQAVQDNTQLSKDSFEGLQEILNAFEDGLVDGVKSNEDYLTSFNDIAKMHEANTVSLKDFSSQLASLDKGMHNSEVLKQLQNLELANQAIYDQFQKNEVMTFASVEESPTIASEAAVIQQHLMDIDKKVKDFDANIAEAFGDDLENKVANRLHGAFDAAFGENSVRLKDLLKEPDNNIHKILMKQIANLPTLKLAELEELGRLGLSETSLNQMKNVITVTNKYNTEFVDSPVVPKNHIPLTEQIKDIKKKLTEEGIEVEDKVVIPKTKKRGQEFTLDVPDGYKVEAVYIKLPEKKERNYTRAYHNHEKIRLRANVEGEFGVRLKLKLIDDESNIDVFQPMTWSWKLHQKDTGEFDIPDSEEPVESETGDDKEEANEPVKPEPEESNPESDDETVIETFEAGGDNPIDDKEGVVASASSDGLDEEIDGDVTEQENGQKEETEQENGQESEQEKPEPVKIKDNYITHEIMTSLTTDSTGKLINASANTVSEFHKILMLYEVYFGLDMNLDHSKLIGKLKDNSLDELAKGNAASLYHLFNEKDIGDLLSDYVVKGIKEHITAEVRGQVEGLQTKITEYRSLVAAANKNSEQMAKVVEETTEKANVMNKNLASTLDELANWREASLELLADQENIATNVNEEQTALLSLDGQFASLLAGSQSLAEQAKGNLQSADGVYQSFDAIDNQARIIQESGTTLVTEADTLAVNMTDKLLEDQSFADNFAGVLENSRVGERPNENLYSFLSNPVQTKNAGVITTGDTLTPYFLVLIGFIVSLFTAYGISTNDQKRQQKDSFEGESTLIGVNTPISLITAGIGVVEGLVIGIISGSLLNISQEKFLLWIALITVAMLAMLLAATYLLRQLKMIGMFVLLITLSLYLFSTSALGSDFDKLSLATTIRKYSPLQYIESLLGGFVRGVADHQGIIFILVGLALLAFAANLFVVRRSVRKEGVEDEGITETR